MPVRLSHAVPARPRLINLRQSWASVSPGCVSFGMQGCVTRPLWTRLLGERSANVSLWTMAATPVTPIRLTPPPRLIPNLAWTCIRDPATCRANIPFAHSSWIFAWHGLSAGGSSTSIFALLNPRCCCFSPWNDPSRMTPTCGWFLPSTRDTTRPSFNLVAHRPEGWPQRQFRRRSMGVSARVCECAL